MLATKPKVISKREEFCKNPELNERDLQVLRDWLASQPHLPKVPDEQLILFLHSCFYDLEKAKKTIEALYTICASSPDLFSDRDPLKPGIQAAFKVLQIAVLPKKCPNGCKVLVTRMRDTDPAHFVYADVCKLFFMAIDYALHEEGTVAGYHFIHDVGRVGVGHVMKFNFTLLRVQAAAFQDGLRLRMKTVNLVNMTPIVDKFMTLAKPLVRKEILQHVHFYSTDTEPLYSYIPKNILPKEWGGNELSLEELSGSLRKKIEASREWFVETENWKADESKRIRKSNGDSCTLQ